MFHNFNKFVIVCGFCLVYLSINGCCQINKTNQNHLTISENLIQKVEKGNKNEFTTALFLLSHLTLNDSDIKSLISIYKKEQDPIRKIFIVFTLYQRTLEKKYENDFISLYPLGEQQKIIWNISRHETEYVNISSPLQQRLATFAITNKEAFIKLLSGYEFADGADGDSLSEQILKIYKYNPEYVLEELKKNNIDLSEFGIN